MPAKVYLDSPPGDFRAMPARGDGLAIVKWVTSFPANPQRGLPVVAGVIVVSDADTGETLAVIDGRSVTWLRTGRRLRSRRSLWPPPPALGRADRLRRQRRLGRPLPGCRRLRPGRLPRPPAEAAESARRRAGLAHGTREEAAAQEVVVTCTPGETPVILGSDLRAGQHLAVLGADGHGKRRWRSRRSAAADCSATSGSRRAPAASWPRRSPRVG